jgi:hypothetical protein
MESSFTHPCRIVMAQNHNFDLLNFFKLINNHPNYHHGWPSLGIIILPINPSKET